MIKTKIDISKVLTFVSQQEINLYLSKVNEHIIKLTSKNGAEKEYLGWIDLPERLFSEEIVKIKNAVTNIRSNSEVFVLIGIGGSYLGARAIIESLSHHFPHLHQKRNSPIILYAGYNVSADYLSDLLEILDKKDYSLVIISKSGTTTEPAVAFRFLKEHLIKKYGNNEARKRIIAITDASTGALKELTDQENYTSFVIPDDVGGRYSVLSPVGLLPIAVAGFNIDEILKGAKAMKAFILNLDNISENPAVIYAATRNALNNKGYTTEIMANYEPKLYYLLEWWKQLFGESEGKNNKGIFPSSVNFTTDLHSMGQYIQDGPRTIFETVISIEKSNKKLPIPFDDANLDNINYLAGKSVSSLNINAEIATTMAHVDGGVPNIRISIPEISEYILGELIYFFEFSCALSAYTLGVNPFDQPGVEAYKKNMFALLGKPGNEKETIQIKKRLE